MKKYETIKPSELLDQEGNPTSNAGVGTEFTGELIEIDGDVYLETGQGYILMENLAEIVSDEAQPGATPESDGKKKMSASTKKLIFALVGLGLGFGIAKYKKLSTKGLVIASIAGIGVGLLADYLHNKRS
jgi:hypothetical protein